MSGLLPADLARRYEMWLGEALDLAGEAGAAGEVPVGALVVGPQGEVLGRGANRRERDRDPVAHAEVVAMRQAAQVLGGWRLDGCTLAVTLEPCPMCAGAAVQARVDRVVLGAWDERAGACGSVWDLARDPRTPHLVEVVGGIRAPECVALLRDFFGRRRGSPGRAQNDCSRDEFS